MGGLRYFFNFLKVPVKVLGSQGFDSRVGVNPLIRDGPLLKY